MIDIRQRRWSIKMHDGIVMTRISDKNSGKRYAKKTEENEENKDLRRPQIRNTQRKILQVQRGKR